MDRVCVAWAGLNPNWGAKRSKSTNSRGSMLPSAATTSIIFSNTWPRAAVSWGRLARSLARDTEVRRGLKQDWLLSGVELTVGEGRSH